MAAAAVVVLGDQEEVHQEYQEGVRPGVQQEGHQEGLGEAHPGDQVEVEVVAEDEHLDAASQHELG